MRGLLEYVRGFLGQRRGLPRQFLEAPLTLLSPCRAQGWCHDIGEAGLGATLPIRLDRHTEVLLQFQLTSSAKAMVLPGRVRYATPSGQEYRHGFEFTALDPKQREAIQIYLTAISNGQRYNVAMRAARLQTQAQHALAEHPNPAI